MPLDSRSQVVRRVPMQARRYPLLVGLTERLVNIRGNDLTIIGDDADTCAQNLPRVVHEAALEYAAAAVPSNGVIVDVGANLGWVAAGFGWIVPDGRVIAVEASPSTYANLARNIGGSGLENVTLVNRAISDKAGSLEFFDCDWYSAGSFVKEATIAAEVHVGAVTVPAVTLDQLVTEQHLDRVDLIKIDIEGHELPALRGARETIERFRPSAIIEMNLFATTSFGNTLPLDYLAEIRSIFPYVYDYRFDLGLFEIRTDDDVYGRVWAQFLSGLPTDLICRFDPLPADVLRTLEAAIDLPVPTAELHAELAATREELAHTRRALELAREEIEGLRGSTSWRLTAPARWASEQVTGLRARRNGGS
jgi:FkbM family methyltransferase